MHPYSGSSLLLLGLMLLGACSDDGFVNQSSGQSSTSTTGHDGSEGPAGVTGPPATAPDDDTALPTSDTSSASGPVDTSSSSAGTTDASEDTTAATSEGTTGGTTEGTTTGGPNQDCADGCVVEFLCSTKWTSEADCVTACEANLLVAADFSIFCRAAWEGVSACVSTLTCEEFEQWENPMMFPYPCSNADTVLTSECEGQ